MYLRNKNILEYAEIVVTDGNSRILNIEGHSKDTNKSVELFTESITEWYLGRNLEKKKS